MYRCVLPRRGSRRDYFIWAEKRTDIIWAMSMVSRDCTPKTWNHNIVIHTTKLEIPYYLGVDVIQYMTIISIQLTAPIMFSFDPLVQLTTRRTGGCRRCAQRAVSKHKKTVTTTIRQCHQLTADNHKKRRKQLIADIMMWCLINTDRSM